MLTVNAIACANLPFANAGTLWDMAKQNEDDLVDRSHRLNRFKQEVDLAGGPAEFMEKYALAGEANYVSQIINGHRPLGERSARNWERKCGWPSGYLDWSNEAGNDEIFQMILSMPPEMRQSLEEHIRTLYRQLCKKQ
jgi:hypothetical protein